MYEIDEAKYQRFHEKNKMIYRRLWDRLLRTFGKMFEANIKYYIDAEKCFEFWIENSSDCGNCIAVCPFSKIKKFKSPSEFWRNKEKK